MKKEQFQKFNIIITLLGIFIFGIFIFPHNVFADIIYSQSTDSSWWDMNQNMVAGNGFRLSTTGTGLTGSFGDELTLMIKVENQTVDGPKDYIWTLESCETAYATCITIASFTTPVAERYVPEVVFGTSVPVSETEFNSNRYYYLKKAGGQFNSDRIWGENSNFTIFSQLNNDVYETPTGITSSYPANEATDVNASTTFTGTYSNAGLYDKVAVEWKNLDQYSVPTYFKLCQDALVGEDLGYTCSNVSLSTNTNYQFNVYLCDSDALLAYGGTLENSCTEDTSGPYVFTTGLVYAVQDTPTSAECASFDVGCYLENALGWFFGVSQSTLNNFGNLTLRNSIPFSYLYDLDTLYEKLFLQDPEDINIVIPFGSGNISVFSTDQLEEVPFQALVRTIMGAIMIFGTTMTIYRRVIRIHDFGHKTV